MEPKRIIACDFDGTITQADVTDVLLAQFAHPSWRDVEQEWMRGSIGSRECLERQMALVEASADELNALIDSVPIDPGFPKFYRSIRSRGIAFYVMTDGFDTVVRRVLKRAGIDGQFRNGTQLFASSLRIEGRRMRTAFPYSTPACEHGCATCKASLIRELHGNGRTVIFVGDGLSDRFAVHEADRVFAKWPLAAYCGEKGIGFAPFQTFADVDGALGDLLRKAVPRRRRQVAQVAT